MDRARHARRPRVLRALPLAVWPRLAVWGALLAAASAVGMVVLAVRPFGSADELYHIDYAYQVWHGGLPVYENGPVWHPVANWLPVQLAAQHPPLYYVVLAPIVGPLADAGHPVAATVAGRMVSALFTVATVACLAWAGSLLSRTRRREYGILTAAAGGSLTVLMHVGGSAYNDSLSTLLTVAGLALAMKAIRAGVTPRILFGLALVSAAGGLTRGQFLITSLVVGVGVALAVLVHHEGPRRADWAKAAAVGALPFLSALLAAGWFYWRNLRLTGNWTGEHVAWGVEHLHRVTRPISSVLIWPAFWGKQWQVLHEATDTYNVGQYLLTVVVAIALAGGIVRVVRQRQPLRHIDREHAAIVLLLSVQAAVALASEVAYVAHAGGNNLRYQLPALLPVAAVLAAGILSLPRRLDAIALLAYLCAAWTYFTLWILQLRPAGSALWTGTTPTGFPRSLLLGGVFGVAAGSALLTAGFAAHSRTARVLPLDVEAGESTWDSTQPRILA
jgi:hypothetical protein